MSTDPADSLVERLLWRPWGQVSASVYETGRVVTFTPWLVGHRQRIDFLTATQRPDGGWGPTAHPGYALGPTLSAVEALLGAGGSTAAVRAGLDWLADALRTPADALPDLPAIELIVPSLVDQINTRLGGTVLLSPAGMSTARLELIRRLVGAGAPVPTKLPHALEVAGAAALRSTSASLTPAGSIGASPGATAAWLGAEPPSPDDPGRRYLETAAGPHGGPVPCGLPITVFERGWVLAWLLRAGVRLSVPAALAVELTAAVGPDGAAAAAGLPLDADTSAGALYALALLGRPRPPDALRAYETPTHFCTWPGEDGDSVTTNAHVLEAFGVYAAARPDTAGHYAPTVAKVAGWLAEAQLPEGCWQDRWHASPYYATFSAAVALARYGGPGAAPAVRRALDWLRVTQRPDGSWGVWAGTAEETGYAVQALLLAGDGAGADRVAAGHGLEALNSGRLDPTDGPALWHDKDLYRPDAIVTAAVLAARRLGTRSAPFPVASSRSEMSPEHA